MPEHLYVERIGAGHERPQRLVDCGGGDLGRLEPLRESLAPAADALIGEHLNQRRRALPPTQPCEKANGSASGLFRTWIAISVIFMATKWGGFADITGPDTSLEIFPSNRCAAWNNLVPSPLRKCVHFCLGRKPALRFLGEFQQAVDRDLEYATTRADELDIGAGQLLQSCPRTEGFGLVASTAAVVDDDLHRALLRPNDNSGLVEHSPDAGSTTMRHADVARRLMVFASSDMTEVPPCGTARHFGAALRPSNDRRRIEYNRTHRDLGPAYPR